MTEEQSHPQATFLKTVLELAVSIELSCAAVYEIFAESFKDDEELTVFWRLYAETERYHAASIRIHQASFTMGPADGDAFPTEAEESERFLSKLILWRDTYREKPPSRREAFEVASEMESSTAELHGRTQFFKLYPHFEQLFDHMVQEDLSHRNVLNEAIDRFC